MSVFILREDGSGPIKLEGYENPPRGGFVRWLKNKLGIPLKFKDYPDDYPVTLNMADGRKIHTHVKYAKIVLELNGEITDDA